MTHPKDILDKLDHDMVESLRRQAEETPRPKKITVKQWRERKNHIIFLRADFFQHIA